MESLATWRLRPSLSKPITDDETASLRQEVLGRHSRNLLLLGRATFLAVERVECSVPINRGGQAKARDTIHQASGREMGERNICAGGASMPFMWSASGRFRSEPRVVRLSR